MRIGYGRVSAREQNLDAQHDALTAVGCVEVFVNSASGKLASRPQLDQVLLIARAGDQLVVTKLDRLGRSLEHLLDLSALLQDRDVLLVILDHGLGTSTPVGRMFFQILGAIAEFEDAMASERTRARVRTDGKRADTVQRLADEFSVSRPTIYHHLQQATDEAPRAEVAARCTIVSTAPTSAIQRVLSGAAGRGR